MATEYVTHRDLDALRAEMRGEFTEMRSELAELRGELAELRGEMKGLAGELRSEFASQTRTLIYANFGAMLGLAGIILAAPRLG
ncbi:MAG: hypothetical protein ACR2IR_12455 [Acidimicrobiia bacterium]